MYAVLHSVLIFWLPYGSFSVKDTPWDYKYGRGDGIDVRGFATFCSMIWAMQLAVGLITLSWTKWNIGVIIFSQVVFFIFAIILSLSTSFTYDWYGVALQALNRPAFYLCISLVCGAFMLVELTLMGTRLAVAPRADETARLWESKGKTTGWGDEDTDSDSASAGSSNSQISNQALSFANGAPHVHSPVRTCQWVTSV